MTSNRRFGLPDTESFLDPYNLPRSLPEFIDERPSDTVPGNSDWLSDVLQSPRLVRSGGTEGIGGRGRVVVTRLVAAEAVAGQRNQLE